MAYQEVSVSPQTVILSNDINQLQENIKHCAKSPSQKDLKLVSGTVQLTWSGVSSAASATITFATDSELGDPEFTTTPWCWVQEAPVGGDGSLSGLEIEWIRVNYLGSTTPTQMQITANATTTPAAGKLRTFKWFALGY